MVGRWARLGIGIRLKTPMTILMTGGSGFLGSALRRELESRGAKITSLSRSKAGSIRSTMFAPYGALPDLPPQDVVINLAGESVVGLWTKAKRARIYDSRIDTTRLIADWIGTATVKPK